MPDFLVRLRSKEPTHVILETKGYDPLIEIKVQAARRWVSAVNHEGSFGALRPNKLPSGSLPPTAPCGWTRRVKMPP